MEPLGHGVAPLERSTNDETMNDTIVDPVEASLLGPQDPEIVALESRIRIAQLAADVTTLDELIAEPLLFTGPDGELGTKSRDLEGHASGFVRFRTHEPEELRIRRVGQDVAITALRTKLSVEVGGRVVHGTYRYTRVWAREAGDSWRVVGGHVSEVPTTSRLARSSAEDHQT
jgi:ketosteroid isomerase-like protein